MTSSTLPLAVIPARLRSTRFPNKILAPILGKPMIQYVWEAANRCTEVGRVIVATDSEEIAHSVKEFGAEYVMTSPHCNSGTDRVAEACLPFESQIVVNLQGDEPLICPKSIDALVQSLIRHPHADLATLAVSKPKGPELHDSNAVKVLVSEKHEAIYFSRQPLSINKQGDFLKHIGIYAYRKPSLLKFCQLKPSGLEQTEGLEQLRAMENGYRIQVVTIEQDTVSVDVPLDIERVETFLKAHPPEQPKIQRIGLDERHEEARS